MSSTETLTKSELDILFERASDAVDLMIENPATLRMFVDLFKKGKFSDARNLLNVFVARRLEVRHAGVEPEPDRLDQRGN